MSIALETPTALPARSACASEDTPGWRGRADVNRVRDLDGVTSMQRRCVSRDTPDSRGRADVNPARGLDGAASTQRMCVRRHTLLER